MNLDPQKEQELRRLEALYSYQILDTPEAAFDHITRLAARLFKVPMAAVTLIDQDRAFLKSTHGLPQAQRLSERSQSFCSHAIGSSEVMVVPDATQDPRFAQFLQVTGEMHLRFYAGAPLIHPSGVRLGALCVLDTQPRPELTAEEQSTLEDLATMVMDRLGLRLAASEAEASEARYRFLTNAIPQQVWTARPDGGRDYVNQRILEFFERTPEQLLEWGGQDVVHPDDLDLCLEHWRNSLETGETYEIEFRMRRASDGEYLWHLGKALPLKDPSGKVLKWFGTTTDISETKRTEGALLVARFEAERANRAKSEFLSRMSHELRTPLNAIIGFSYLLEKSVLTPRQHDNVGYIHRAGHHLLELINDVLDVSSIEAGRLALSLEAVPLEPLLRECLNLMGPQAEAAGIRLEPASGSSANGGPANGTPSVRADRRRLQQVLLNLLSNAIKYNRAGGRVTLTHQILEGQILEGQILEKARLRIAVTDTGPGITPDLLERLFIPFDRLGAERTSVEGTGLGLSLSKHLMEGMGGTLTVSSREGEGSTFWLELPLEVPSDPLPHLHSQQAAAEPVLEQPFAVEARLAQASTRCRVLCIEDGSKGLERMSALLEAQPGLEILVSNSGLEALSLVRDGRFDLIGMDFGLPDMSGFELLKRLKSDPESHGVPGLVFSAQVVPCPVERLMLAGAHSYLPKPLERSRLLEILARVLSATSLHSAQTFIATQDFVTAQGLVTAQASHESENPVKSSASLQILQGELRL